MRDFEIIGEKTNGIANINLDGRQNMTLNFLKDACIYFRRIKKQEKEFQESQNGFFRFEWFFDIEAENYKVKRNIITYNYKDIPFPQFKTILVDICENFETYFHFTKPKILIDEIEPYKTYFSGVTNILKEENYSQLPKAVKMNDFTYLLHDLVENCFTDGSVTLKSEGFDFDEIKAAFNLPIGKLKLFNSKKEPLIDFSTLTINGNLEYDFI